MGTTRNVTHTATQPQGGGTGRQFVVYALLVAAALIIIWQQPWRAPDEEVAERLQTVLIEYSRLRGLDENLRGRPDVLFGGDQLDTKENWLAINKKANEYNWLAEKRHLPEWEQAYFLPSEIPGDWAGFLQSEMWRDFRADAEQRGESMSGVPPYILPKE